MTVKQDNKVVVESRGTTAEVLPSQVLLVRSADGSLSVAGRLTRPQLQELRDQIDDALACRGHTTTNGAIGCSNPHGQLALRRGLR